MLAAFFSAFILVGGLCVLGYCIYLLIHNGVNKPNYKDEWLTVGDYRRLSTEDKLKYHKHKGHIAEKLDLKYPLSTLVTIKFRDLEILYKVKNEDGKEFFLDRLTKFSLDKQEYRSMGMNQICYKLDNGKILKLYTSDPMSHSVLIKLDDHTSIGFIHDYDNIIEWESLTFRDEIIQAFKKLDVTLEESLRIIKTAK